jgi:hypothetical protein
MHLFTFAGTFARLAHIEEVHCASFQDGKLDCELIINTRAAASKGEIN